MFFFACVLQEFQHSYKQALLGWLTINKTVVGSSNICGLEPQYFVGFQVFHQRRAYLQQVSCCIVNIAKISGFAQILESAKNLIFRVFQGKIMVSIRY